MKTSNIKGGIIGRNDRGEIVEKGIIGRNNKGKEYRDECYLYSIKCNLKLNKNIKLDLACPSIPLPIS